MVIGVCTLIAGIMMGWGYGAMTKGETGNEARTARLEKTAPVAQPPAPRSQPSRSTPPAAQPAPAPVVQKENIPPVLSPPTSTPAPVVVTAPEVVPSKAEPVESVSIPVVPPKATEPPPVQQAAITTPPPPVFYDPGEDGQQPAWLRYAVAVPDVPAGKPLIVVVIDDMGVDRKRTERIIALPGPLTTAFLPYAEGLPAMTASARARGHELLVHVPMEPLKMKGNNPGPGVLMVGQGDASIRERLNRDLSRFDSFVGINNHMGSRFTSDVEGMKVVADELRRRGLLFLDSVTSDKTVAGRMTRQAGVPTVSRNIFLDNVNETGAVLQQLSQLEGTARKAGFAIAIGHPRDGTISALAQWLPTLKSKGFVLVPVSFLAKRQSPPS